MAGIEKKVSEEVGMSNFSPSNFSPDDYVGQARRTSCPITISIL